MNARRTMILFSVLTVYNRAVMDTYLCTGCGFYENYVLDEDKLAEAAQKWDKAS